MINSDYVKFCNLINRQTKELADLANKQTKEIEKFREEMEARKKNENNKV